MDQNSADRDEVTRFLAQELNISHIRDYCPNGLQVEGSRQLRKIVTGVSANLDLIDAAIEAQADALFVHHGYFWQGEDPTLTGIKYGRIRKLIENNINLYAYHLPLDLHESIGNNALLGKHLGLFPCGRFGENDIGWLGHLQQDIGTVGAFAKHIENILKRKPFIAGDPESAPGMVAWCTGAAQGMLRDAAEAGASVFISGEISERTLHEARESGIAYLACGHHATERYGIEALGELISARFGICHQFIEIENPV